MKDYIIVAVSPFYNGRGWTDSLTGIDFEPREGIYAIRIDFDKHKDLRGVANSIRLNNLLLLEGELPVVGESTLDSVNPEELTKEELQKLATSSGGDNKGALQGLRDEISELEADKVALESENSALESDKASLESTISELEATIADLEALLEAEGEGIETLSLGLDKPLEEHTNKEIQDIAKENGIELTTTTKKEMVEEIKESI